MGRVTRIFSRSRYSDKGYVIDAFDHSNLVWFPEIDTQFSPSPVHPFDQIKAAHNLIGKSVVTLSEYIILWFLQEVRERRMEPHKLELYCDGHRIRVDQDGELMDRWPGGFYRERATLLF